jgi:hypothetical protein
LELGLLGLKWSVLHYTMKSSTPLGGSGSSLDDVSQSSIYCAIGRLTKILIIKPTLFVELASKLNFVTKN